eukprot:TRINITY_DN75173_c0_g1_i1.p1 TRINITY_DN75173_c0_g1~~TRINITY_DN75173_c0_g1_i1.p1  ORF type:complete len:379 (+),score=56.90 TRINITY_DN75173_c0_g1_i1:25-1161(+)
MALRGKRSRLHIVLFFNFVVLLTGVLGEDAACSPAGNGHRSRSRVTVDAGAGQCASVELQEQSGSLVSDGTTETNDEDLHKALDAFNLTACEEEDVQWFDQRAESEQQFLPRAWGLQDRRPGKQAKSDTASSASADSSDEEELARLLASDVKHVNRTTAFRAIYSGDVWGGGPGPGSSFRNTIGARCALNALSAALSFRSLWDVSGDFQWMKAWLERHPEVRYEGADVVPELAGRLASRYSRKQKAGREAWTFVTADIVCGEGGLSQAAGFDVILLREVLQHLTPEEILQALQCVSKSGAKWLLVTNFDGLRLRKGERVWKLRSKNLALESGVDALDKWRWHAYDLTQEPYSLPQPFKSFPDDGKVLNLYKLPLSFSR